MKRTDPNFFATADAMKAVYTPSIESRELALYAINNGTLYRGPIGAALDILAARVNRGRYNAGTAARVFYPAVNEAARLYIADFCTPDYNGFTAAVKRAAAAEILSNYTEEVLDRADRAQALKIGVYTLRERMIKAGHDPHFWDDTTLKMFGERVSEMRVSYDPDGVKGRPCYVLVSKQHKAPGGTATARHYIDAETYAVIDSAITFSARR